MAKPTTVPLFDTNGTRIAAPAGTRISDGYALDAPIISQDFNYMFYWLSQWISWLNTGNVIFNNVENTGTLTQDGAATFLSTVGLTGDLALTGMLLGQHAITLGTTVNNVDMSGGGGSLSTVCFVNVTPNVSTGTDMTGMAGGSLGRIVILYNAGTTDLQIDHGSSASLLANRFNFVNSAALTVPPRAFAAFVYGADSLWELLFCSAKERLHVRADFINPGGAHVSAGGALGTLILATSTQPVYIPFEVQDTITTWIVEVIKNTSTGTITAQLVTWGGGTETILATQTNSANAPGVLLMGELGVARVPNGGAVYIKVTPTGGVSPSADRIHQGTVIARG